MAIDPPTDPVVDQDVAFLDARGLDDGRAVERVEALIGEMPSGAVVTVRLTAPPPAVLVDGGPTGAEVVTTIVEPPDVILVLDVR